MTINKRTIKKKNTSKNKKERERDKEFYSRNNYNNNHNNKGIKKLCVKKIKFSRGIRFLGLEPYSKQLQQKRREDEFLANS